MDIVMWLLAGAAAGWVGFSYANLNEDRGRVVSMLIGAAGGFLGGKAIAPMFGVAAAAGESFALGSLVVAAATAGAFLYAGNQIQDRWGI